jgi:deazaflavin-dependent oxidoreductase (nitroreductase family)
MAHIEQSWFVARVLNPIVQLLGAATTLVVVGRTSGKARTVPVNVLEHDGQRYLLSARGESEWVRNLRAAGRGQLRRRGRTEDFRAEEVPTEARPPIIAAYRAKWDKQVKRYFEQLPDPADHPTFRVDTDDA